MFKQSYIFLVHKLAVDEGGAIWEKLGPYSCLLNVDEVDDIDKTW